MLPFLAWVPAAVSLVLGMVYLFLGDARPPYKALGALIFFVAVYLQFFSGFPLSGLLLQVALAVSLVVWRRVTG